MTVVNDNDSTAELLMRYSAGALSPAPALVVACHLAMSAKSRRFASGLDCVGGTLLDDEAIAPLSAGLFERTVAKLDQASDAPRNAHAPLNMATDGTFAIPQPLANMPIGRWRWLGPGMRYARVEMPDDLVHNLILLRVPPGRTMPEHSHSGEEITLVLNGGFSDGNAHYGVGDLVLEDEKTTHAPIVDEGEECICLAAVQGPMRIKGLIGKLIQPFIAL